MSRELSVLAEDLAAEVAWLNKMPTSTPETAVIQVTSMLGAFMVRRTCFDQYQEAVIPAQGGAQGTALVDASKLAAALKKASGWVGITIDDERLVISTAGRTVRLRTSDLEFPKWPPFKSTGAQATLGAVQLSRVLTSVGTDDTLPMLMAVAFDGGSMVTTDRFRLTRVKYDSSGFVAMVPALALRALVRNDGVVYVEPGACGGDSWGDSSWVELTAGGRTVLAPTVDVQFPKWRQLIPTNAPVSVTLRRDDLLNAVDGDEITITVTPTDDDKATMSVIAASDGMETEQEIELLQVLRYGLNDPFTVTLRSQYVRESMRGIGCGMVLFDASASDKPIVFQDISETNLHLIMPVRQKEVSEKAG